MKKIIAIAICALMMLAAAVPAFAGQDDAVFTGAKLDLLVDLDNIDEGAVQMRGFTVSPDGKYAYCGFLQGYRHVTKVDTATGEHVGEYAPEIEYDEYDGVVADNNYPKGLAVDCRGYLFVGITHDVPNTSYISIACVDPTVDSEGMMKEISTITENMNTDRVGINGIAAQKIGDKILLYVLTCYNKDTLRCYDVTDVTDIKLYKDFGVDGVIDYNELTGSQADPGYLTVDVDGYIYLCYLQDSFKGKYDKGSHVMKIEKNGKDIVNQVEVREAYGICNAGDYLFVSTHDGPQSKVVVLNKSDLSSVGELVYEDQFCPLSGCGYGGDYLYVGDHGDNGSVSGSILKSSELKLTRDPRETETVQRPEIETEAPETEPEGEDPGTQETDSHVVIDFTDPDAVAKLKKESSNNVDLEYDEVEGCLKISVTGEDPYFMLPMKKADYFDGDKYNAIVLNYKTAVEYATGEIFFLTKDAKNLAENHINYDMEEAAEYTDLEIDMRDDDNGNWEGQVRKIRIDPSIDGDTEQVFYIKSVSVKVAADVEETEPVTEVAPETNEETSEETAGETAAETDEEGETAAETKKESETKKNAEPEEKGGLPVGAIIAIIAGVVVAVAAVVAVILIVLKKKKK